MADFEHLPLLTSPVSCFSLTGTPSLATFDLTAAGNQIAWIFQAPEAIAITQLGVNVNTNTTPPIYKISLQGVTFAGNAVKPDGTIKSGDGAGPTDCYSLWTPNATGFTWHAMDGSGAARTYTAARGEWLAVVMEYSSGTIGASNYSRLITGVNLFSASSILAWPVSTTSVDTGATWTMQDKVLPVYGIASNNTSYGYPLTAVTTHTYDSGTAAGSRRGLFLKIPSGVVENFQILGARMRIRNSGAANQACNLDLYENTTLKQSVSIDENGFVTSGTRIMQMYFDETILHICKPGNTYRLILAPQSATADIIINCLQFAAGTDTEGEWPGGQWFGETYYDGTWHDDGTHIPMIEPIIVDWTPRQVPPRITQVMGAAHQEY
jgi:hypothetical protein